MVAELLITYCKIEIIINMMENMMQIAKKTSIALIMYFTFVTSSLSTKDKEI